MAEQRIANKRLDQDGGAFIDRRLAFNKNNLQILDNGWNNYVLTVDEFGITALTEITAGTSSFAVSASYANTASYAFFAVSSSYALSASYAISASNALTASYVSGTVIAPGNNTEVIYNRSGSLFATSSFTWDTQTLRVTGSVCSTQDSVFNGVCVGEGVTGCVGTGVGVGVAL